MTPTIGRVVHYTPNSDNALPFQAAIITAVEPHNQFHEGQPKSDSEENKYCVHLHVFHKSGQSDLEASWSAEPKPGCWNWPPRV